MGPSKEKIEGLNIRMNILGIKKNDIEEKFIKASGRGGQKVNKSASAVFLKHIPTGLTAKCGKSRSQHLNRFLALRNLVDKIEALEKGAGSLVSAKADRIKKQKMRRKRKTAKKLSGDRS